IQRRGIRFRCNLERRRLMAAMRATGKEPLASATFRPRQPATRREAHREPLELRDRKQSIGVAANDYFPRAPASLARAPDFTSNFRWASSVASRWWIAQS